MLNWTPELGGVQAHGRLGTYFVTHVSRGRWGLYFCDYRADFADGVPAGTRRIGRRLFGSPQSAKNRAEGHEREQENPMEGEAPKKMSTFWKSRLGITSAIVAGAAVVGAVGYAVSAKKTPASSSGGPGASNNPSGPYLTSQNYPVTPGQWYTFDIGSSSHWTDANWQATGAPALQQALVAAGFNAGLVIQPDPSDPSASTYLVAAQWPSGATATQFADAPPAWYVKPATMQAIQGTPPGVQQYSILNGDWFTFTVWTGLPPNDPNFTAYVQELLTSAGFANVLVTQSATNPADANVAAQWGSAAGGAFNDGWPLWGIVTNPVDTGSTQQPAQPGA